MNKLLIPVDFSETSINAAKYAVSMAGNTEDTYLVFYNVYDKITLPMTAKKEEGSRFKVSELALEGIKNSLDPDGKRDISCVVEEGSFIDCLSEYVLGNNIDLVIMGITGSSKIKQVFMGTNTLNAVRSINCPVMIIPPQAQYSGLKKIVFTSDFHDVARTTPFEQIKKVLNFLKPELQILNVNEEHYVELSEEYKVERRSMEAGLDEYHPEYSFLRSYDFVDGISTFVETRNIDAILTLPRKQSVMSQLFKTSHTKKLAYHSKVPIIAIPSY